MAVPVGVVVATTALTPIVWGTTYAVTTELLPPDRPLLAGALRALPAGLLLLAVTRRLPHGQWWWRAGVLGSLNVGAFFALLFVAAYRLPGGVAAVLGAVQPLVVAGLALALLGERSSRRVLRAAVAGAGGVALAVLTAQADLDAVGLLAGLGATVSAALGLVLTKRWTRPVPLLAATAWQLTAGGLVLAPVALLVEGLPRTVSPAGAAGYAYLSLVGGALAYANWFHGLERLAPASLSLLALLSPVVATALGWALLEQALTPLQVVGVVVALAAVVTGQLPDRRPAPVPAGTAELAGGHRAAVVGWPVETEQVDAPTSPSTSPLPAARTPGRTSVCASHPSGARAIVEV